MEPHVIFPLLKKQTKNPTHTFLQVTSIKHIVGWGKVSQWFHL